MDIFERMRKGELTMFNDPDYPKIDEAIQKVFEVTEKLNSSYRTR